MKQRVWRTFTIDKRIYEWVIQEIDPSILPDHFIKELEHGVYPQNYYTICRDNSFVLVSFYTYMTEESFEEVRAGDDVMNRYFDLEVIDIHGEEF